MHPDYEIIPGKGIGKILFGTEREELFELLGDPDEIEIPEEEGKQNWESYRYNSINCAFTFGPDQDDTLVEITVENSFFHIADKIRVGLAKEDLLVIGRELDFGQPTVKKIINEEFPDREEVIYQSAGLKLWIDEGLISGIRIFLTD